MRFAILNNLRFLMTHPLTKNEPLAAMMRVAHWQVQSRLKTDIVFEWIEGQKLVCNRGMSGATGNIYVGLHELDNMAFLLHFLRGGDLFIDVGANVGCYCILASGVRRARSIAFEPSLPMVDRIDKNIEINGLQNLTTVHRVAVGDRGGSIKFTNDLAATVNHVTDDQYKNATSVPIQTLDSFLGDQSPIMAKIDVEGYEDYVIRGAEATLSKPSLKAVQIETVSDDVAKTMTGHGFERLHYNPFDRSLTNIERKWACNSLFVRDRAFIEKRLSTAKRVKVLSTFL